MPAVIFSIIGYVIGIPVLIFTLFRSRIKIIKNVAPSRRTAWQKFLLRLTYKKRSEYKPQYEYWDTVLILRKASIIISQLFFSKYAAFQAAILIIVLMSSLVLQTLKQPYATKSLNALEGASLFSSCIVLILGIMFYINEFHDPKDRVALGFTVIGIIFACVVYVALAVMMHAYHVYQQYKATKAEKMAKTKALKT